MRALVVIPTYNEAASLRRIVEAVRDRSHAHVLVVDDASPDGTGDIADWLAERDHGVHVLHRERKEGLGPAYRAGMRWALASGYDAIGEMDADGSHDPADVPRLLAALGNADLVIGSRYMPLGGVRNWSWPRRLLSRAGNTYVRLCTGLPVADATAGFRMFRRATLLALDVTDLDSDGYSFQIELALRAHTAGFRVVEVPITFVERTEGVSKMSRAIVAEALLRVPGWGLRFRGLPQAVDRRSAATRTPPDPVAP